MSKKFKTKKAFSVVELMVAIGLFTVTFTYVGFYTIDILRFSQNNRYQLQASNKITEEVKLLNLYKRSNWGDIYSNADGTPKKIEVIAENITISDGQKVDGDFTSWITITDALRNPSGELSDTGSLDFRTKRIDLNVSWNDFLGSPQIVTKTFFMNDWNLLTLTEDLQNEFNDGTFANTATTLNDDGEVSLDTIIYANWCEPSVTQTAYDLPGSGIANNIRALPGKAHIGTASTTGTSYMNVTITDDIPPGVVVESTVEGYKANSVFGTDTHAYIANDLDTKEIVILDIQTIPYTEVGFVDGSGTTQALDVYIEGNRGYFLQGNQLRVFDASSPIGSRSVLGSYQLADTGLHLYVRGNYAYVLLTTFASKELQIIDISSPASMFESGYADVNVFITPNDLYVNEDATRIYIGNNSAFFQRELFLVDITAKTGARPTIASYETNGMSIKDLVNTPDNTRILLAGTSGEEYQVVNIENESSLTRCGGLQINSGVDGVAAVIFDDTFSAYAYVTTNDSSSELKVIRGGQGTGGGNGGVGYVEQGEYHSSVLDTGDTDTSYSYFTLNTQVPNNTSYEIQFRAGNNSNLSSETWIGPDGSSLTSFNQDSIDLSLPQELNNKRYIQYKIVMHSDTISTPVLEDITIYYQT